MLQSKLEDPCMILPNRSGTAHKADLAMQFRGSGVFQESQCHGFESLVRSPFIMAHHENITHPSSFTAWHPAAPEEWSGVWSIVPADRPCLCVPPLSRRGSHGLLGGVKKKLQPHMVVIRLKARFLSFLTTGRNGRERERTLVTANGWWS